MNAVAVDGSGNVIAAGGTSDYVTIAYSSAGVPLWTNVYNGPGNFTDSARALAIDSSGNVLVTGFSFGTGTSFDYATIKYSNAGVPLWTNRYNGPGSDQASAVALDGSGNVFVTGNSFGFGSSRDYLTIAYSSAGVPLWTNRYNGPGNSNDLAWALAVDGSGNVVVTGESIGSDSSVDYATIKYSNAGVPLWTNRYNGPGNGTDSGRAIAIDSSGNVIVTGWSVGNDGSNDYATIKYSSAGLPLWTNRFNGPANGDDFARAVRVDGSDNVVVTGSSAGIGSSSDYLTIAYSSAGLPLWTNRYNGPANGADSPGSGIPEGVNSLGLGPDGSVYVTGISAGDPGGANAFATVKYLAWRPELLIQMAAPEAIRISWPTNAANYVLEFTEQLAANAPWAPVNTPVGIEGSNFSTTNRTDSSPARFYRLRRE
jgi:3-isopropylmalate dehydratase small subunit